jgi:hypothetical protein
VGAVIPVTLQPEPAEFDTLVRQRGLGWLRDKGWAPGAAPPQAGELPTYWRETNKDLWRAYRGVCAYLCIFFDWGLGAASTDHFVAKSDHAGLAYEWSNYRLSCLGANRRKNRFDDVLDPFELPADTFELDLVTGAIRPSQRLDQANPLYDHAHLTIRRLGLDEPENREMRARQIDDWRECHVSADYLHRYSPFVWRELSRQGLLR